MPSTNDLSANLDQQINSVSPTRRVNAMKWKKSRFFVSCLLIGSLPTTESFSVQKTANANSIHRIVFGTAALSKAEDPIGMLDVAYEKGVRRFDLARTYGMGESERIFGKWLESRDIDRSSIDIITKGGIGMDRYGDADRPLLTEQSLRDEVDLSLDTLKLNEIDLYMFHRDDGRIGVDKFVDWINAIVATRKIKRWGVSNWSFDRFKAAYDYALKNDLVPPSANSPQFSLAAPCCDVWPTTHSISQPRHEMEIQWYADNSVELLCWEVLAKGFMAKEDLWPENEIDPSTFNAPVVKGSDEWRLQRLQRAYCNSENYRRRELAIELASKSCLKLAQIAMLYPLTKGKHISVIFGSSKASHIDDMVELQHLNIDESAMALFLGNHNPKSKRRLVPFVPEFVTENSSNNIQAINSKSTMKKKQSQSAETSYRSIPAFSVKSY